MACGPHFKMQSLTWILCKDSKEGSSQTHAGTKFNVFFVHFIIQIVDFSLI